MLENGTENSGSPKTPCSALALIRLFENIHSGGASQHRGQLSPHSGRHYLSENDVAGVEKACREALDNLPARRQKFLPPPVFPKIKRFRYPIAPFAMTLAEKNGPNPFPFENDPPAGRGNVTLRAFRLFAGCRSRVYGPKIIEVAP